MTLPFLFAPLERNLPREGLIDGAGKIADMTWIWKVFGTLISQES
jgi:hypothetical protein